jgi:hypothetical protein
MTRRIIHMMEPKRFNLLGFPGRQFPLPDAGQVVLVVRDSSPEALPDKWFLVRADPDAFIPGVTNPLAAEFFPREKLRKIPPERLLRTQDPGRNPQILPFFSAAGTLFQKAADTFVSPSTQENDILANLWGRDPHGLAALNRLPLLVGEFDGGH